MINRIARTELGWLLIVFIILCVPIMVWGLSDVVTRDSNQTPCPAVDDSTGECRNLRYNSASKGLDVNMVGSAAITVGAIGGATTPSDALANPTTAILDSSLISFWNGSSWDRSRSASASAYAAGISQGSLTTERGGRWSVYATPNVAAQATISRSAGVGGVRHVADCISYTAGAVAAPAATALTLVLRDGASGAGNIMWSKTLIAAATATQHVDGNICGLNLVGSAATAMTLEFTAGLANESESVALTGFDVQ